MMKFCVDCNYCEVNFQDSIMYCNYKSIDLVKQHNGDVEDAMDTAVACEKYSSYSYSNGYVEEEQ